MPHVPVIITMSAQMLTPIRTVRNTGAILLVASLVVMALTNPIMAGLSALGVFLSCFVKLGEETNPVTKRRALNTVWGHLGAYAIAMSVLCALTIGAGMLFLHGFYFWQSIVFYTLIACWLPFVMHFVRRK